MPIAFVLVNYDLGTKTEEEAIKRLKNVPGVIEVSKVNGEKNKSFMDNDHTTKKLPLFPL